MRLDRLGKSIHEKLEDVFCIQFIDPALEVVVTLGQGFDNCFAFLVGQFQAQIIILDTQAPQLIQFSRFLCPGLAFAVVLVVLVNGEVKGLLDTRTGIADPLSHTIQVDIEYFVCRQQVRMPQRIVQRSAITLENLDIGFKEIDSVGIQQLQITIENLAGELIIQARILVMPIGQELGGKIAGIALLHLRFKNQRSVLVHRCKCSEADQQYCK